MDHDLNITDEEENVGDNLCSLRIGKAFLQRNQQA